MVRHTAALLHTERRSSQTVPAVRLGPRVPSPRSVSVVAQVCTIAARANAAPGQQMDGVPLSDVMVALLDFQPLRAYQRRACSTL